MNVNIKLTLTSYPYREWTQEEVNGYLLRQVTAMGISMEEFTDRYGNGFLWNPLHPSHKIRAEEYVGDKEPLMFLMETTVDDGLDIPWDQINI